MKEPCSPALEDVEITWTGKCAEKGGGGGEEGGGGGSGGPPLITTGFDNSMPQIRNPVDRINVMAGELLQYQVKSKKYLLASYLMNGQCQCQAVSVPSRTQK